MSHDHHGGAPASVGAATNHEFARGYWYIAAGVVGLGAIIRGVNYLETRSRLRSSSDGSTKHPTRPSNRLSQAWATTTALVREASHPQLYIPIKGLRWATPPPLGKILLLLVYWAVIVYLMSWNVVKKDVFYWERIGYRNGWVTMTQLPMLYLLSMKINPIGLLMGSSHERLNWLHRWVARTMLITATVHGFHFWTMWDRANFITIALEITPLVKYGLGAWGILIWLTITGILPLRRLAYELWVAQHVIASIVMLWLMWMHIPAEARYLLWMSVSFLVFDRVARWALLAWRNVHFRPFDSPCQAQKRIGHHVSLRTAGPETTLVTIKDVHFPWRAGQHIYLWLPRVGLLEAHPYTIACAHKPPALVSNAAGCYCNSVQLIIRAHGGFSRRLYSYAAKDGGATDLTGFLSGPYGEPPRWEAFETLVLIGASTGASFTVPILESVAQTSSATCVRKVEVVLLARKVDELEYYISRTREAAMAARQRGLDVRIHIAITGDRSDGVTKEQTGSELTSSQKASSDSSDTIEPAEKSTVMNHTNCCCCQPKAANSDKEDVETPDAVTLPEERLYTNRPDIEALIREPVEQAWGETAVVVCGGKEVVARTRNCVSSLSDERAVHKGTGAQGIFLHVEEYAF